MNFLGSIATVSSSTKHLLLYVINTEIHHIMAQTIIASSLVIFIKYDYFCQKNLTRGICWHFIE